MRTVELRQSAQVELSATRIKHLKMIQAVLERISTNSAHTKKLALTIVAAAATVAAISKEPSILYCVLFLLLSCAWTSASYLRFERKSRRLFDEVREEYPTKQSDFRISIKHERPIAAETAACLFSWSNAIIYGSAALCLASIAIILE